MSVRRRKWITGGGDARYAWVCDYRDRKGARRLKTFAHKLGAEAFAFNKKNGPAATAIAPDLGSHNPDKENEMNKPMDTTSIPNVKASDEAIAKAMKELETDIHVLFHMSDIMSNNLDGLLLSQSCRVKTTEDGITIRLTDHEVAQASFLSNAVAERCELLSKRFAAAWNGEVLV